MNLPFSGGCVCGEVRYECTAAPLMMLKCHCRDCQRISGGPDIPAVIVPIRAFRITRGEIAHFGTPSPVSGVSAPSVRNGTIASDSGGGQVLRKVGKPE